MARKTVRVDFIRTNADDLIVLMNRLIDQHVLLGTESPLKAAEVTALKDLVASATTQRRQAKEAEAKSQSLNNTTNSLLGIAKGKVQQPPTRVCSYLLACVIHCSKSTGEKKKSYRNGVSML
jgi:hypothetical protein